VEVEGSLVRFRTDHIQADLAVLLGWAERHQVDLVDLQVAQPTLDSVFVRLAGPATEKLGPEP
jgi:hypothetical protein